MKYHVLYACSFRFGYDLAWANATRVNRAAYVLVAKLEADNVDDVFRMMQSEFMSPENSRNLTGLIEREVTDHTSMSVGDMVKTPDGRYLMCNSVGWREVTCADIDLTSVDKRRPS